LKVARNSKMSSPHRHCNPSEIVRFMVLKELSICVALIVCIVTNNFYGRLFQFAGTANPHFGHNYRHQCISRYCFFFQNSIEYWWWNVGCTSITQVALSVTVQSMGAYSFAGQHFTTIKVEIYNLYENCLQAALSYRNSMCRT